MFGIMPGKDMCFKMTAYYRIVKTVAWPLCKVLLRFRATGKENIPKEGGLILCCNHTSIIDIAILVLTCDRPIYFMAKEELFKNPLLGWFFRHMGGFPVARGAGDDSAMVKSREIVKRGDILGIFPEGTRTKDTVGHPGRGKSGAAVIASETGADVLPCAIHYSGYDGKIHLFRRSYVRYGEIIGADELKISGADRTEIRRASARIMDTITEMWEADTEWKSN